MTVESAPFFDAASLTFSLPDDGTIVGQQTNRLNQTLINAFPKVEWQEALARAFQTWANSADVNFGYVQDTNDPLGVYGPLLGDARFGDVRIAGVDTSLDTLAEAVAEDAAAAGSWAGDILFNTAVTPTSLNSLSATAIHEIGHVLGLEHSSETQSVMFAHQGTIQTTLSSGDIQAIQRIHGARRPDGNEILQSNNNLNEASRIRGSDDDVSNNEGFNGTQVWVQFGGLASANDVDYYFLPIALGYTGPVTIEVRTAGVSLSHLSVELMNHKENVISTHEVTGTFGGSTRIEIEAAALEKYYLRIGSGTDPFWAAGNYAITITTPSRLNQLGSDIVDWTRQAHRWYSHSGETLSRFSLQLLQNIDDHPRLSDDGGVDDDAKKAMRVEPALVSEDRIVHRIVGSIAPGDVDHYRIRSPEVAPLLEQFTITIDSLEVSGLIPEVSLFDSKEHPVAVKIRVKGNGQVVLEAAQLAAKEDYTIRISASSEANQFRQGNFVLTAQWSAATTPVIEFAQGALGSTKKTDQRIWYVAKPQLFALSLLATSAQVVNDGIAWLTIFDAELQVIAGMAAPLNEVRSAPAILLQPGAYYLQTGVGSSSDQAVDIHYRVFGETPDRPLGPLLGDPQATPFYDCGDPSTAMFCFPDGDLNSLPYLITEVYVVPDIPPDPPVANPTSPQLPTVSLPKPATISAPPTDNYFWNNLLVPTNPVLRTDVDGNGKIQSLDALLIINRLNTLGTTAALLPPNIDAYYDVNHDGQVSPLDALLVINELNK